MTRDGLPRAYLRMDPNLDQHSDALSMLRAMCAANRQPERGRFRDPKVLERAVGRRQYREMVERGDVVQAGTGVYLDGWDEWQEGDHTVGERMRRMRERRKRHRATSSASLDRNQVTTDAVAKESTSSARGVGVDVFPPPPAKRGRRKDGTNPRSEGTAPRQNGQAPRDLGESPRQRSQAIKRDPTPIHVILARANENRGSS